MRRIYRVSLAVAGFLAIVSAASAQQPLHWELSIDAAKQVAARSNRLVLIEFSAPWCGQCRIMENEVFSQPGVARAIEANYVPVRINVDYAPETAKMYRINGLPTTVVIAPTPQGDVLAAMPGRVDATTYLTRLNGLAAAGKQPPSPPALIAGGAPPLGPPAAVAPLGLEGYCPVRLVEKRTWIRGDARWGAIHQGRTYLFCGPEEQRQFFADPNRYAPVRGGDDVVLAVEQKHAVPGCRRHGASYAGRIYLFADEANLQKFIKNPGFYAEQIRQAAQSDTLAAQQVR
jgi:YHS domain-containing protein/thioredoxin-related protein